MSKRKYVGVPTQEEIIEQYKEITNLTKEILSVEQVKELLRSEKNLMEAEVNCKQLNQYENEPVEVIRYEYKNILVYVNIVDGKAKISPLITLYSDDGLQFADEMYDNYECEIERVAGMKLLRLVKSNKVTA